VLRSFSSSFFSLVISFAYRHGWPRSQRFSKATSSWPVSDSLAVAIRKAAPWVFSIESRPSLKANPTLKNTLTHTRAISAMIFTLNMLPTGFNLSQPLLRVTSSGSLMAPLTFGQYLKLFNVSSVS
jgi:hypothetical protein